MTKDEWIAAAAAKLKPYDLGGQYVEDLYSQFVEGFGDEWGDDPEGAVAEDMSYWDADD